MAWKVNGLNIAMTEEDYGIELPLKINGVTLDAQDSIKLTFKDGNNGETILEKTFNEITDNTVKIVFSDTESALFPIGAYVYRIDWYQDGNFMCNIVESAAFRVVDKA